jgi:hypothetical protein
VLSRQISVFFSHQPHRYNAGMNWPSFSLKQLFVSMFLMSAGMGVIAFSFRSLPWQSVECAAGKVLGAVAIILGAVLLVTKQRRTKALIWVLGGILIGIIIGSVITTIVDPSLNHRRNRHLVETIGYISAAIGALIGFAIVVISAARPRVGIMVKKQSVSAQPDESPPPQ